MLDFGQVTRGDTGPGGQFPQGETEMVPKREDGTPTPNDGESHLVRYTGAVIRIESG